MVSTLEYVNLDYNIVDNTRKTKDDISMFELSKLELKPKLLMKAWKVEEDKTSNVNDKGKETTNIVKTSTSSSKNKSPSNLIASFNKMPASLNNAILGKICKNP